MAHTCCLWQAGRECGNGSKRATGALLRWHAYLLALDVYLRTCILRHDPMQVLMAGTFPCGVSARHSLGLCHGGLP